MSQPSAESDDTEKQLSAVPVTRIQKNVLGLGDGPRNDLIVAIGEFVGTFMFLFFAFAIAQAANSSTSETDPGKLIMISLGFGFSLATNVFIFFRVSGGQFNPAVSLALALVGAISPIRAAICAVSQIIAGMCAAAVVSAITPGEILFANSLGDGVSKSRGLFIEMFMTIQLCLAVLFLAVEKHRARPMAPLGIGFALFINHLVGVYFTGAGMNPARSFGPAVAIPSFPVYHWIYWVGPIMGAIFSAGFYLTLKFLHKETANPGQDDDGFNDFIAYLESRKEILDSKIRLD
ncbi:aquaporin-like protein [Limtongia smithiae]|uniref:aquaporin-like protein n=1 Tax=Limtongia smithiae TaxID=1125753 RepID=UPI0034CD871B